ncbi:MAG: XdhC family protein [Alteripontixanthobacter sp.]
MASGLDILTKAPIAHDAEHAALIAACEPGVALCTIVGIEGSFSRRLGAQLAVHPDGSTSGSLADGCLERQLAADVKTATGPVVKRYGRGSPVIDFRLPCGGGLDILIDPQPDRLACRSAAKALGERRSATLDLPETDLLRARQFIPALRIAAFGEGPEIEALATIARAANIEIDTNGSVADLHALDRYSAIVLLFHDHERERDILGQALASQAFYIGAQGGENARNARAMQLLRDGVAEEQIARIRGPIGSIAACRTPQTLALSVLCEIAGAYEKLQPHR